MTQEQISVSMDAVIEAIKQQRNSALDSVALYSARCQDLEARLAAAEKELNELRKADAGTKRHAAPSFHVAVPTPKETPV